MAKKPRFESIIDSLVKLIKELKPLIKLLSTINNG